MRIPSTITSRVAGILFAAQLFAASTPQVQWSYVDRPASVGIPGQPASEFGVMVECFSYDANVQAFMVKIRYRGRDGAAHTQTKVAIRTAEDWTRIAFDTMEQVEVLDIHVEQLAAAGGLRIGNNGN